MTKDKKALHLLVGQGCNRPMKKANLCLSKAFAAEVKLWTKLQKYWLKGREFERGCYGKSRSVSEATAGPGVTWSLVHLVSGWASAPHSWFGTRKVWVCVLGVFCLVAASVSPVAKLRSGRRGWGIWGVLLGEIPLGHRQLLTSRQRRRHWPAKDLNASWPKPLV